MRPITEGTAKKNINLNAYWSCEIKFSVFFWACAFERLGKRTVPIAIAKIPIGNCIKRSDTYNQVGLPVTNNEAKMVSTNRFIWAIPPAMSAGRIKIKNFLTPGLLKLISGKGIFFIAARGASWKMSCKTPASNTPQANAITGISTFGAISQAEPIKHKLNINGVIAGIENLSWEFWIPAAKATREINARYGNIILKRLMAKSCFWESK